jgi:hypothetical protein
LDGSFRELLRELDQVITRHFGELDDALQTERGKQLLAQLLSEENRAEFRAWYNRRLYWFSVNWNLPSSGLAATLPTEVLPMTTKRKHYSAPEKVAILRLHLLEKKPVSDLCDEHGIHPTLFYRWQKELFENGAAAFEQTGKRVASGICHAPVGLTAQMRHPVVPRGIAR